MKKIILHTILLSIAISSIFSQTPQAFKYQAVARDNTGVIISNQLVSFRISILQGSATGTSMYSETHQLTTNDFGLANLEIGSGSVVSGSISSIDWSTGSYFLKVEMDANGGSSYQLVGASQMLSVPYALYAESSANPGDDDWTISGDDMYSTVAGNVGIGTAAPGATLEVAGHIFTSNTGSSVFLGWGAGYYDDLSYNYNVYIGQSSGNLNTTGDNNTACGSYSLFSNVGGADNTVIGQKSLYYNVSGNNNTAIGNEAGHGLYGGSVNGCVFLGNKAGYYNGTDNRLYIENSDSNYPLIYGEFDNDLVAINGKLKVAGHISVSNTGNSVFIGQDAGLNDDLTANNNVFIGNMSGTTNTSGYSNSALGEYSMNKNTNGYDNTALGSYALYENTIGGWNTAIGRNSMKSNINGGGNVAIGGAALASNETGDNNTIIGASAGSGAPDLDGCVFIGHGAGSEEYSDNRLHIGNSYNPLIYGEFDNDILSVNGKLGIATENPAVQLHVVGGTDASLAGGGYIVSGTTTSQNIVMDENEIMARNNGATSALHLQRNGGGLRLHYDQSDYDQFNINSSGWTGIGVTSPNSKLHVNTSGDDGLRVQIYTNTKFLVHSNGGVVAGHNVTTPTFAFQLQNSNIDLQGRGRAYSWNTYSDSRLKSNQRNIEYGLKEVLQLQPKSYDHHSSSSNEEGEFIMVTNQKEATVGFIAQEVQQIIPEAVCVPQDESKDLWSMDYDKLIPVLTKAIQEQQAMIEELYLKIERLESK